MTRGTQVGGGGGHMTLNGEGVVQERGEAEMAPKHPAHTGQQKKGN